MKQLFALLAFCIPIYLLAQGFGSFSHDQPYFAKDRSASGEWTPASDPYVVHWWVHTDLTNNGVAPVWTARLGGAVMSAPVSVAPTNTSSGVYFDGGIHYLTNRDAPHGGVFIGDNAIKTTNTIFCIIKTLSTTTFWNCPFIAGNAGFSGGVQEAYFGGHDLYIYGIGGPTITFPSINNRVIDLVLKSDALGTSYAYTNGVLAGSTAGLYLDSLRNFGDPSDPNISGYGFKGYIMEAGILVSTNLNLSEFHKYATNTYGYTP